MRQDITKKIKQNQDYWNDIADVYNNLYDDNWSNLENNHIASQLKLLLNPENSTVLDLGCGTGLGYEMCKKHCTNLEYTGVDVSNKMIVQFKERHPNVRAIVGDMGSLTGINENSFDFVISTFSAFSFTDDIALTVKEIKRVLKPDGKIMITGLGKYSLRRLLLLRFGDAEVYKTRGSTHQMYTKAWVFSKKNLMSKFSFENFTSIKVEGYNAFGGLPLLTKFPSTWRISKLLSQLIPNISHELIITAKINKS